ncbi:hypothetical protein BKA82DRAFT_268868 [Pisolithus tinctorius]|uniref:Transmembrane protein n=1 Tax=Pisolithus tinctorius Marx 270 TaxID=870435 RepID=A0A0C3PMC6_PISTI|nr:hypothetical protein BKA82DRAFT_268868 [Pisolithus tinctorius]KIO09484.1 hypothetical protein M404DRAFT_268868 [Pisolithus tinctorius Marx 270]
MRCAETRSTDQPSMSPNLVNHVLVHYYAAILAPFFLSFLRRFLSVLLSASSLIAGVGSGTPSPFFFFAFLSSPPLTPPSVSASPRFRLFELSSAIAVLMSNCTVSFSGFSISPSCFFGDFTCSSASTSFTAPVVDVSLRFFFLLCFFFGPSLLSCWGAVFKSSTSIAVSSFADFSSPSTTAVVILGTFCLFFFFFFFDSFAPVSSPPSTSALRSAFKFTSFAATSSDFSVFSSLSLSLCNF